MNSHPMDLTGFHAEAAAGDWRIEVRTIDRSPLMGMRPRSVPPGTYTGLLRRDSIWMSDTPDERRDHSEAYYQAKARGGRMLVHGLGLGMVVKAMLDLPTTEHVDVVEREADVISLAAPAFAVYGDRLTIHHADCFEKTWPTGTRWTVVWHDIWRDICVDNLAEMATLHRKFGRRCDWQGSWSKGLCEHHRRRESRYAFA